MAAKCAPGEKCMPNPSYNKPKTITKIYDISNRESPELEHEISVSGNHANSRMIGNYVYLIANEYARPDSPMPLLERDGEIQEVNAKDIYYYPIPDYSFQYTNILAIDIEYGEYSQKTVLSGASNNMYVSKDNIYLTAYQYPNHRRGEEITEEDKNSKNFNKQNFN